jgi:uncharacterized protein (TIGR01319 family)
MAKIKICKSCGRVMKDRADFSNNNPESEYCGHCTDEFGYPKRYSKIVQQTKQNLIKQMAISEQEAKAIAIENVVQVPHWAKKAEMMHNKKYILITDIGSTTTKAVLFEKSGSDYHIIAIKNAATTVEKPNEDVNIGVRNAVKMIEAEIGKTLISESDNFIDDVLYLSTSSAGGGLQIMVVGLTMFDSASSAKRTAYGAGGVILDTFSIDDKRDSLEQMKSMANLHPDIILMSGGIDGGAVSPILRLGEILQFANPVSKFNESGKIPLVFAGNKDAQELIAGVFNDKFELYMTENLRPEMMKENLEPARKKIHELFMDNVMEQAPGYQTLKKKTSDNIIPTPMGVIRSLQIVAESRSEHVICVDIGGATTDIFSYILDQYYRTVSANYGMSYSISNVMKDCGFNNLKHLLPVDLGLNEIRNYIANKMLYPTFNPTNSWQIAIEHALAVKAIQMSKTQHLEMNFNRRQIGFLDKLKQTERGLEKLREAFYVSESKEAGKFSLEDINIMIGAGGVLAHTQNPLQALIIIYKGLQPLGITEIWRDKNFISPHLGKLSAVNEQLAKKKLENDCYEKLAIIIRPMSAKWKKNTNVMNVKIDEKEIKLKVGDLVYLENKNQQKRNFKLKMSKGFFINKSDTEYGFTSNLPILIDCMENSNFQDLQNVLHYFDFSKDKMQVEPDFLEFIPTEKIKFGKEIMKISLSYNGDILVKKGDRVTPDTLIGENKYDPPKIYVISLFDKTYLKLTPSNLEESLRIKVGDEVKLGQRIVEVGRKNLIEELKFQHYYFDSPVRGRVERINFNSGTIIMREIQDYSNKPVKINVAKKLNIKPKLLPRYMSKNTGDFIYSGDVLAKIILDNRNSKIPLIVDAPSTGTITDINRQTGIVTIQYIKESVKLYAGIIGEVAEVEKAKSVVLNYEGATIFGSIGFGRTHSGNLHYINSVDEIGKCKENEIVAFANKIDLSFLGNCKKLKLGGVIAASIDNKDLVEFIGNEIGVALTGNESIPFPLIITEGFGDFKMKKNYREFFKKQTGKMTFMNGHTQIRAGVTRPKIIVMN